MSDNQTSPKLLPVISSYAAPQLDFQTSLVLSFVTAVLVPCFQRGSAQRMGILALQIYFTTQAYIAPVKSAGNLAITYSSGLLLGNLTLRYLDRLYLHTPEEEFRRVDEKGVEENPKQLSWLQKLGWSAELLMVTRGVGWNWRVKGTPNAPRRGRLGFALDRLVRWIAMYGALFAAERACEGILNEWAQIPDGILKTALQAVTQNTVFLYVWIVLIFGLCIYTHFAMLTLPLSLLCVGFGIGPTRWQHPEAWPATFGSVREAHSLRRFWSHCWHQQVRRILNVPPTFVLSSLPGPLRSSSRLSTRLFRRYLSVILAFGLSGAFHCVGHWTVLRERRAAGDVSGHASVLGEMPYFVAQGLGIILEDLIYYVTGSDSRRASFLGYVATAAWYTWTRVQLKTVPIATTFGISDPRGPLFEVVELLRLSVMAIPGNFVKMGVERWA